MQCAVELVCRDGYAAVTLADIAQSTGLTKGAVLYYYKTKEALIEAAMQYVYTAGARYMSPRIDAEPTMRGKLRAYITSNIMFMHDYRSYIVAFISVITNISSSQHERMVLVTESNKNTLHMLTLLLKSGQANKEFGAFDPAEMALTIRGVIDGAALQTVLDAKVDLRTYADTMAELFLNKLQKE